MKAVICPKYGSPDVLQLQDVAKPAPNENEVLIKIEAASVNPLDWHKMRGDPFLVRLSDGFSKPKDPRLGADVAGIVEEVGAGVTQFQPGDEVYGEFSPGGLAEYICAAESKVARKPANLSFEEAAAIPVAGLTALQGLRDHGEIQAGQSVLINGASGGVGTFAVQMAKFFGAEVTGVCSTRNVEMVRSLGADHIVDYTQADFTRHGKRYDLVFDAVGNCSVADYKRVLTPSGNAVVVGFTTMLRMLGVMLFGMLTTRTSDRKIGPMLAKPTQDDLNSLREMVEAGTITPVIDRHYPLIEAAEAIRYLETGRARGKVVVTVGAG